MSTPVDPSPLTKVETHQETGPVPQQIQSDETASSVSVSSQPERDDVKPEETPKFVPTTSFLLAFTALAVLTLMVALDGTSFSVALPVIAKKLHGTAIEAFWVGTSFLLASTVFQPNYGSFSHIFGRMPVIMVSIALFFIGVMMAGMAKNFDLLLAGRTIQGIGGGGESVHIS
ncbi:hypothetical protein HRR83_001267 [Exophiala dermatitidis]|nr:hypothetical protein HRR74_001271 [Exophiala dermatitidis]KAJ4599656.1 hypothetical protein HRR84_003407 [Exophiala dermatitidis]KAJ4605305.1 hypothetical protein HRR83_001267 [Exophiala dermatitidis]KAJ4645028.1 hypothetical protein HRR89_002597 [Exophiala dermatitidis]KAJ4658106.1 hypothetical protein HRR91_001886 [Exophiala dermatitidis]